MEGTRQVPRGLILAIAIPASCSPVALRPVNTMKTRLQSLGLLDRGLAATTDDEIEALVAALDDDHREAVERLAEGVTPAEIREATSKVGSTAHSKASPSCSPSVPRRLHRAAR